jgi:hypothetical protein
MIKTFIFFSFSLQYFYLDIKSNIKKSKNLYTNQFKTIKI